MIPSRWFAPARLLAIGAVGVILGIITLTFVSSQTVYGSVTVDPDGSAAGGLRSVFQVAGWIGETLRLLGVGTILLGVAAGILSALDRPSPPQPDARQQAEPSSDAEVIDL